MAKKTARQKIYKKLDDLTREAVRLRDNNCCQKCGKPVKGSDSQPSHIIPKSRSLFLRWDLLNILLMDNYCHIHWWHQNPMASGVWFKGKYPTRYNYLFVNEHHPVRWRMGDLRRLQTALEQKIKDLKQ